MMVPQFSFWQLSIIVILSCTVIPSAVNAELAFVRPNTSVACGGAQQPCLTFNEYAQQVDQYFVDNTTFLFLPGTHELDIQLDLEGLSNISFVPLGENDTQNIQILLNPSTDITWINCDNVELGGLVFFLSGQFSTLSEIPDSPSAELHLQNTSAFLTNLTLLGSGTRLFVVCNYSYIQISYLVAMNTEAPILFASSNNSIDFYGQNIFLNNIVNDYTVLYLASCYCNFSGNTSFINTIGIAVTAYNGETYISGNISFLNNIAAGSQIHLEGGAMFYITGSALFLQNNGGAAINTETSTLFISGIASFIRNQAVNEGAIKATNQARIVFEVSSIVSFIENSATNNGGAIHIEDSNLTMHGEAIFKRNYAALSGGAITIIRQGMLNCSGRSVIFQNNSCFISGGAIYSTAYSYATSCISDYSIVVELRDILFERNVAREGGAVCALDCFISMTGNMNFIQNSALNW